MLEDPPLEAARRFAGREPELAQARHLVAVHGQRLDLAAGAVEGQHERAGQLLAQGVGRHEAAQLGHRLQRPAELDERPRARLLREAPQILQPPDLGLRPVLAAEVAERRAAPQRERGVERLERRAGRLGGGGAHRPLEALGVDLVGTDREPVAGAVADEQRRRGAAVAVGLEERAQVRDPDRERACRHVARHAAPGGIEQRVGRHGAARIEQEPREDGALLRAGRGRAGRWPGDLDRAEDAELHELTLRQRLRAVNDP